MSAIRVQKDNYKTDAGVTLGESAFWQSSENEANVVRFKRAKVQCRLEGFGLSESFELIVSLRAGFVRVRLTNPRSGLDARQIAAILRPMLALLYHVPGHKWTGVLVPMSSNQPSRYILCKTYDPYWLVGTLHEVMQENKITCEIDEARSNFVRRELEQVS